MGRGSREVGGFEGRGSRSLMSYDPDGLFVQVCIYEVFYTNADSVPHAWERLDCMPHDLALLAPPSHLEGRSCGTYVCVSGCSSRRTPGGVCVTLVTPQLATASRCSKMSRTCLTAMAALVLTEPHISVR